MTFILYRLFMLQKIGIHPPPKCILIYFLEGANLSHFTRYNVTYTCILYARLASLEITLIFIGPSSDGTYYGMVMSVRPGLRPSVRHSFPHFSSTCFDILI